MSDRYRPTSNTTHYQPVQCYYNHYQYSESNTKSFLTNEELDYLENVISKSYSVVPSKGYLSFNAYSNNSINSSVDNNYYNSEPNFKGQLSKYFPESIRSNFNDAIDFNELKASELIVSDNSLYNLAWDEFYDDSNETDMNSNNEFLNSNPSSNSNMEEMKQSNFVRSNSAGEELLDYNYQIIQNEQNKFNPNKISMINRRRGIIKNLPKEKKIICMKDCLHVWEFLRDLLKDNRYNNHIIKWLDQKRGIFKILDPNSVSSLWGKKKLKKSDMKYPNMARGIRYSREEGGYFDSVSKNLGYGKKLVYKFSKKTLDHCEWLRSVITEF